jgi:hypothetical protein
MARNAKKKKKKVSFGWKGQILLIAFLMTSVMFASLAVIMVVGMIPTIVAAIVDRSEGRTRSLTIGAMNFAGCVPFMLEIFKKGNSLETSIAYMLEPRTIVVIYFAAAMGYLIDWAMTGIVSSVIVQKTKGRLREIKKDQKELTERWGMEVTGTIPLDEFGFPKDNGNMKPEES